MCARAPKFASNYSGVALEDSKKPKSKGFSQSVELKNFIFKKLRPKQ